MSEIAAYSESLLINKNSELTLIINLPNDVWNEIFNYLNPLDVFCVFTNVCKAWRMLIIENNYLLKDYISILNIKNTRELFNNINLLQKYKRYLFRKYIQQVAHQFAELQILLNENNENNENNEMQFHKENKIIIEKLIEMNYYCNLFYISKDTESLKLENNSLFNNNFFTNLFTNFNPKQWLQQLWSPHSSCFDFYYNNQQQQQQELLQQNSQQTLQQTTMNDNNIYLIKSIILGNSGVGKTSFLKASILKEFEENAYGATVGVEFHSKTFNLGKNCPSFKLQLWDTTGAERFRSIINIYYKSADGFFICFDLTNSDSFHCVKEWKEEIDKHTTTSTTSNKTKKKKEIVLLGTKLDLTTNNKQERKVERKEAEQLEFEMELIYEEISNKEMMNVDSPIWYLMLMQYCLNQFKRI